MTIRQAGPVQLLEAVDDLGNSLLPPAVDDQRAPGAMAMMRANPPVFMGGGSMTNLTARLQRPEKPGRLIKALRGTLGVEVSALRSNPLVIPPEGAAGKTFEYEGRRVVVHSVSANPDNGLTVIELSIADLEELSGPEPINAAGAGRRGMMMGMQPGMAFAVDPAQSPIQVIGSQGQIVPFQTSTAPDSDRITLRVHQLPAMGPVKEVRISGVIGSKTEIPFEFHDLPMP
jgi:hypothetical protein